MNDKGIGRPPIDKDLLNLSELVALDGTNLGDVLYSMRIRKGLSQKEAAQKIGVSPTAVWQWENGVSRPNVNMLFDIFKWYGCKLFITEDKK